MIVETTLFSLSVFHGNLLDYTAASLFSSWNQWITLPISYADLPRNAQLCITFHDCAGPGRHVPVGGTTIPLFGKTGVLRQGMYDLEVWPEIRADSTSSSSTHGKMRNSLGQHQMQRLAKLTKKHRNGHMSKIDWLDRLTFREIELVNEREKQSTDHLYLVLEFPRIVIQGQWVS
ncbi:hypothetical protein QAD02_012737 [Eretmocerus hayati]|uniref:Uncharacterized protein n=1 Tax=Eretmocerus hayati TaxID=131215 RepID=A0ACC2P5A7_9HYME|nr:hypothetical protein QAD02_012737 [Eretmocerus hayati]